jgi:beta-glucanase (GH16 family)
MRDAFKFAGTALLSTLAACATSSNDSSTVDSGGQSPGSDGSSGTDATYVTDAISGADVNSSTDARSGTDATSRADVTSTADARSGTDATSSSDATSAEDTSLPGWTLTWSDEFNGPDGSAVDPTKWVHDVGGTGWGNQELEYYTDGTQNAVVAGGNLVITATPVGASAYSCSYGTCSYTSARLKTQGLFAQAYGLFEASIQLPAGQGLWPAFWTLGDNINTVSWPACGEIDIMEAVDSEPLLNHGSMHGPISPGSSTSYNLTATAPATTNELSTSFHTYAIEWDPGTVRFFLDDVLYETQTTATLQQASPGAVWEFDQPFFLLLNVAVGGTFPGAPNATTTFPQTMKVEWVRVYERAD